MGGAGSHAVGTQEGGAVVSAATFNRSEAIEAIYQFAAGNSADPELFRQWLHTRPDAELEAFYANITEGATA